MQTHAFYLQTFRAAGQDAERKRGPQDRMQQKPTSQVQPKSREAPETARWARLKDKTPQGSSSQRTLSNHSPPGLAWHRLLSHVGPSHLQLTSVVQARVPHRSRPRQPAAPQLHCIALSACSVHL